MNRSSVVITVTILCLAASAAAVERGRPKYFAYPLEGIEGNAVIPFGISSNGRICGQAVQKSGQLGAFITEPGGTRVLPIGDIGDGIDSVAIAVNAAGEAVGSSRVSNGYVGFITSAEGTNIRQLPLPNGATEVGGQDIADNGVVAGAAFFGTTTYGFSYKISSSTYSLFSVPRSTSTVALSINERGEMTGAAYDEPSRPRAFYAGPNAAEIRVLYTGGSEWSQGLAISEDGRVSGMVSFDLGGTRTAPFTTGRRGKGFEAHRPIGDGNNGEAVAVDTEGSFAGSSGIRPSRVETVAFVASKRGDLVDLNTLLSSPIFTSLTKIVAGNEAGQMAAVGKDGRAYLVCPTEACR